MADKVKRKYHFIKHRKSMTEPPMDKMVKEPESKKEIWELLAQRERDIHSNE